MLWYLTDLALQSAELLRGRLDRALASPTYESISQRVAGLFAEPESRRLFRSARRKRGRGDQDQKPCVSGRMPGRRVFTTLPDSRLPTPVGGVGLGKLSIPEEFMSGPTKGLSS